MGIKVYKPTTPAQRWKAINDFSELTDNTNKPYKKLVSIIKKTGGRNNQGRITSRGRGGGHKRKYRMIDFKRDKTGRIATVLRIEYDPNRSAFIALIEYGDTKEKNYIIAPKGLKAGSQVQSGSGSPIETGNAMPLKEIPAGTFVHNIELRAGKGAQIARSAGSYAIVMNFDKGMTHLKMPSGEVRLVSEKNFATIGQVGNVDHEKESWGKAGRSRWFGWRPLSRAVVKNPVDHPMGGGEGKSSGGRLPCSRSGMYAKGLKTRKRSKVTNKYIIQRRKK